MWGVKSMVKAAVDLVHLASKSLVYPQSRDPRIRPRQPHCLGGTTTSPTWTAIKASGYLGLKISQVCPQPHQMWGSSTTRKQMAQACNTVCSQASSIGHHQLTPMGLVRGKTLPWHPIKLQTKLSMRREACNRMQSSKLLKIATV